MGVTNYLLTRMILQVVQDRTCKFYVVSVYIHPDNRKGDLEALLRAWRFLDKKTEYAFVAGDFNGVDKHLPQVWEMSIRSLLLIATHEASLV